MIDTIHDPTKLTEFALPGVDFCFEPVPEKSRIKGVPQTSMDSFFRRIPKDKQGLEWARGQVAMEPVLLQTARVAQDPKRQAEVLSQLGVCHYLLGDLQRGRAFTEQAALLSQQAGDNTKLLECLMQSAHFHQIGGDVPAAIAFFERVVDLWPLPEFRAEACFNG